MAWKTPVATGICGSQLAVECVACKMADREKCRDRNLWVEWKLMGEGEKDAVDNLAGRKRGGAVTLIVKLSVHKLGTPPSPLPARSCPGQVQAEPPNQGGQGGRYECG